MTLVDNLPKNLLDATNRLAKDLEWGRRLPIYEYHKWWARRYSGIIRPFLIYNELDYNDLPGEYDPDEYVNDLYENYHLQKDRTLLDLFSGGGTIVFEGSKVGYSSHGIELNDVAYWILNGPVAFDRADSMQNEIINVYDDLSDIWETPCKNCGDQATIVHTFVCWTDEDGEPQIKINEVKRSTDETTSHYYCEKCGTISVLNTETESCPECGNEFGKDIGDIEFDHIFPYVEEYYCRSCGTREVQELSDSNETSFRGLEQGYTHRLPDIPSLNETQRLKTNGFLSFDELFSNRQLKTFTTYLRHFEDTKFEELARITASDAVRSCSYLAQYAPKYRKLTPGFAVKSYWTPAQTVELNPLSFRFTNDGVLFPIGRGNIVSVYRRLLRARDFSKKEGYNFDNLHTYQGAAQHVIEQTPEEVDLVFTDPPYADFQYYSDLSLLSMAVVDDDPRFEQNVNQLEKEEIVARTKDGIEDYLQLLENVFRKAKSRLKPDGRMLITYHHSDPEIISDVLNVFSNLSFSLNAIYPVVGESSGRLGNGGKKLHLDLLFVFQKSSSQRNNIHTVATDVCETEYDTQLVESIPKLAEEY